MLDFKEGEILYIDKPLKWTSFAVVNKLRYHISRKMGVKKIKVGHAFSITPKNTSLLFNWEPPLRRSTLKRR